MKKLLLLLFAAIALVTLAPAARAYDRDAWHPTENRVRELYARMDHVRVWRERWGAGPRLAGQIDHLTYGLADLNSHVQAHAGDPKVARKEADNLSDLLAQVEAEYRARAHREGVVIEVYH